MIHQPARRLASTRCELRLEQACPSYALHDVVVFVSFDLSRNDRREVWVDGEQAGKLGGHRVGGELFKGTNILV